MDIKAILILILVVVGTYFLYRNYLKLITIIMIRSHKKRINKGKMTDQKLMKMYHRFNRESGTFNRSYTIYGRGVSQMVEDIGKLYHEEMMRRNLL
ncbi:hypothetical protein ACS127_12860 [Amphibacillus sp. Q70]|uniref:hypothetical protein n=1 Tax=Amphibacillus sp. Q70 TaxID=3453416 RepID=UPI003F833CAB